MIYVDDLFTMTPRTAEARKHGTRWCHLFTDSPGLDELHQFAEKLGLKREWFQSHKTLPHYDLTERKRERAVNLGAKEVSREELKAILLREVDMRSKQEATPKPHDIPVFGDPLWINRSQMKPVLGRVRVIEVNGKRI